jgi:YesN/AraC family two-component response regulator
MKTIPVRQINLPKEEVFTGSFSIRSIQTMLTGKDMTQELHRHDFHHLLVLQKGKGIHEIDFTPYKITDHSIFFMRPGQVHQLNLKKGSSGFLIEFKTDLFQRSDKTFHDALRKAGNTNLCRPDANGFKKLQGILSTIIKEYEEKKEGYHEIIKASLGIFFIELIRNRKNTTQTAKTDLYKQERLEELLSLLEDRITTHKEVSQYADLLNLSVYQLNSITKTMLRKTCSELIDAQIILEGKRHLLATSEQVNQIAYALGYEDASYFIRFFKKHTGYTPEFFRQNFG